VRFALFLCGVIGLAQGTLYLGAWQKQVLVVDEAQQKVVDHIPLATGTPHGVQVSRDHKTIYVWTIDHNGIEVIDAASRKVTNSFALDAGNKQTRFNSWAPDPAGKLLYMITEVVEKKVDRFEIQPLKFAVVDLEQKKIVRTADFPREEMQAQRMGRVNANMHISSDGKFLYLMRQGILVFDTSTFKLVDKLDLSEPESGLGSVGMGQQIDTLQRPGELVGMFTATDPYVHRQVFGIGRFELDTRKFQFTPVGPMSGGMLGLHVTPDGKTGYTVTTNGTGGNKRSEFWAFDLSTNRLVRKGEFEGRARYSFAVSSDGKDLYIYAAGYQIEVYDAATMKLRNTIDVNADITTEMLVLPGRN
jgi:DNA-binding beta-propeller fold protein YncE